MTKQPEALQAALAQTEPFKPDYNTEAVLVEEMQRMAKRIEELEALARPAQEPVAFYNPQHGGFYWAKPTTIHAPQAVDIMPLALYTSPPQREWVGLTNEEIINISCGDLHFAALIGEVIRKLKEKNT